MAKRVWPALIDSGRNYAINSVCYKGSNVIHKAIEIGARKDKSNDMRDNNKDTASTDQPVTKKRYERPQMVTYGSILEFTHGGPMSNAISDNVAPPGQFKSN